jgi:hypothetical protein
MMGVKSLRCVIYVRIKRLQEKEDNNLIEPNVQAKIKLRPDKSHVECAVRATLQVEVPKFDWRIGEDLSILDMYFGGGGRREKQVRIFVDMLGRSLCVSSVTVAGDEVPPVLIICAPPNRCSEYRNWSRLSECSSDLHCSNLYLWKKGIFVTPIAT